MFSLFWQELECTSTRDVTLVPTIVTRIDVQHIIVLNNTADDGGMEVQGTGVTRVIRMSAVTSENMVGAVLLVQTPILMVIITGEVDSPSYGIEMNTVDTVT